MNPDDVLKLRQYLKNQGTDPASGEPRSVYVDRAAADLGWPEAHVVTVAREAANQSPAECEFQGAGVATMIRLTPEGAAKTG